MNKKAKFITFIIVSSILSVAIPMVMSVIPKKEPEQVDVAKLQKEFQKTLEETVKIEKEKTAKEVQTALAKKENVEEEVLTNFAKAFTQYFGEDTKNFATQYSPDKNLWKLTFDKEENGDLFVTNDTGADGWNGYALEHTFQLLDDKKNISQKAEITIVRDRMTKFNINNNDILIQYLDNMLGRKMTDNDKNAINIKVNMNFSDLKGIEDLKSYIYNDNSVKIDNMIIETEEYEDVEKQRAYVKLKITCDRPLDLTAKEES